MNDFLQTVNSIYAFSFLTDPFLAFNQIVKKYRQCFLTTFFQSFAPSVTFVSEKALIISYLYQMLIFLFFALFNAFQWHPTRHSAFYFYVVFTLSLLLLAFNFWQLKLILFQHAPRNFQLSITNSSSYSTLGEFSIFIFPLFITPEYYQLSVIVFQIIF